MAYSATLSLCALLLAGFAVAAAAPSFQWDTKHVFTDEEEVAAQLSPPRRRCACFVRRDPATNKTETYCTADSHPKCHHLPLGELQAVQEKVMNLQAIDEPKAQQETQACVCYLEMDSEANTADFTCSNPFCYKHFVDEEIANTKSQPNFACQRNEIDPSNPCCQCTADHQWDCETRKHHCMRIEKFCPKEHQIIIEGECCPACMEKPSAVRKQGADPFALDTIARQDCCSFCKQVNSATGDIEIEVSRSHPDCQCDLFITYPYKELPSCSLSMSDVKRIAHELAKELSYDG